MVNLLHPFRQGVIIIIVMAINLFISNTCSAQSFTIVPNDTIIGTGTLDLMDSYNIFQEDNSTDTIFLHYEKVSAYLPDQWTALICDNGTCWSDLAQSGNMDSMFQGHDGLLSVHVTPHINEGTAIIRYAVWDISNSVLKDTLTWIISVGETGINSFDQSSTSIFMSGNQLIVQKNDPAATFVRISNLEGKIFYESSSTANEMVVDISNFSRGIYLVEAIGNKTMWTRKIFIK